MNKLICHHCNKPMGNSLNMESDYQKQNVPVHKKCSEEWHICTQMGNMADILSQSNEQGRMKEAVRKTKQFTDALKNSSIHGQKFDDVLSIKSVKEKSE